MSRLTGMLAAAAVVFCGTQAYAYENLCAANPDPSARIKCWQKSPAFTGWVPAQYAVRCPARSQECFTDILARWQFCVPYAQAAAVAYAGTRGWADMPPTQWPATVQKIDASLTVGPYGPQSMKPNYPKLIAAEGFATDAFHANAAEATSYIMNMCLDGKLFE